MEYFNTPGSYFNTPFSEGLVNMFKESTTIHAGVTGTKGFVVYFDMKEGDKRRPAKFQLEIKPRRGYADVRVSLRKGKVFALLEFELDKTDVEEQQREVLRWIQTQLMLRSEVLGALHAKRDAAAARTKK